LVEAIQELMNLGALVGMSDHGVSKSLYAKDPDGIEFEVMWMVPRDQWGEHERRAVVQPLDLERELEHFGKNVAWAGPGAAPSDEVSHIHLTRQ
jgi:catechol-2,3-dioxygenase